MCCCSWAAGHLLPVLLCAVVSLTGILVEGRDHGSIWLLLSADHLGKDADLRCGMAHLTLHVMPAVLTLPWLSFEVVFGMCSPSWC